MASDLIRTNLVYDNGFTRVALELRFLDILRMMEVLKKSRNAYYYNELRWFINQVAHIDKAIGVVDFNRKLPRIRIKEKKEWELQEMLLKE